MQVIDHAIGFWYCLKKDSSYYLDVHCSHGFASFSVLIKLTEDEREKFETEGKDFLNHLAETVSCSSTDRHIKGEMLARSDKAIMDWKNREV
jgi:hypothetical protein